MSSPARWRLRRQFFGHGCRGRDVRLLDRCHVHRRCSDGEGGEPGRGCPEAVLPILLTDDLGLQDLPAAVDVAHEPDTLRRHGVLLKPIGGDGDRNGPLHAACRGGYVCRSLCERCKEPGPADHADVRVGTRPGNPDPVRLVVARVKDGRRELLGLSSLDGGRGLFDLDV